MTSSGGYVLVIGACGIDVKATPRDLVQWETDNLGTVRTSVGGVARNIAENLARLDVPTILLSAVGRDEQGKRILKQTRDQGVRCSHVRRVTDATTGTHIALQHPTGDLHLAISDFDVMRFIDAPYLQRHEPLFAAARLIVIDLNLSEAALAVVFELAARYHVRVCADPTSPTLAPRLLPYLKQLYLVTPNAAETTVMCGLDVVTHDLDTAVQAARHLVALGAHLAIVTLGEHGLAYADSLGAGGTIRAVQTNVVDSTGAGDAFTSAVIFGLLNDVPADDAMRLGVTAASLTLQTRETVVPNLNQELLYARLVI